MTSLIVQHDATAGLTGVEDAVLTVGRETDNDLVLDHPTVSRHHARIDRVAGEYFINDLGSRNSTRVNGHTVRERRPLANGDKIRFGQVRVRFCVNEGDGAPTATLDNVEAPAMEPGILFDCSCGTRLWAKREAATGIVTCGKCQAEVVVPSESTKSNLGETVSGMSVVSPADDLSAPVTTGTCSICQWHTTTGDDLMTCPACGLIFHAQCWSENRGCSAYGCSQVNVLANKRRPASPAEAAADNGDPTTESHDHADPAAGEHATTPEAPRLPIGHALLGASVVAGLLGLFAFGAPSAVSFIASIVAAARTPGQRKVLLLATAISFAATLGGVAVSAMWWLSWTPGGAAR